MIDSSDLNELSGTLFTGITVGVGSQILLFEKGSILVQCKYECILADRILIGDGEDVDTALILFPFLNKRVLGVLLGPEGSLLLRFSNGGSVKLIPDDNGLESYVLNTRYGIVPVGIL